MLAWLTVLVLDPPPAIPYPLGLIGSGRSRTGTHRWRTCPSGRDQAGQALLFVNVEAQFQRLSDGGEVLEAARSDYRSGDVDT
jgi:hypothetical protein